MGPQAVRVSTERSAYNPNLHLIATKSVLRDDGPYWQRYTTDKGSQVADVIRKPYRRLGKNGIDHAMSEQEYSRAPDPVAVLAMIATL